MATASALMADIQTKLGDEAGNRFTSTLIYTWLDEAQKAFCLSLMPLRGIDGTSVATNQESFAIPSDSIMIEALVTRKGWPKKVKRITTTDFTNQQTSVQNAVATDPTVWTEMDGRVYVYPPYSGASLTTTVNASTTAAASTITLSSTGNLRSKGRVEIDSEEIEYTTKATTSISGCRRGVGGTTAATHVSAATVTQVDLDFIYRRHPVTLSSTASPEIRAVYHEKLELYVLYLAYMQEGSWEKAQLMYGQWQQALKDAEYSAKRESLGPMNVRDMDTQMISGLYGVS